MVTCTFTYEIADQYRSHVRGWIELDESSGLVLRNYEINLGRIAPDGRKVRTVFNGHVDYRQVDGRAVPARLVASQHGFPPSNTTDWLYNISNYTFEKADPAEFTLAHYGLADYARTVGQVERRRSYWSTGIAVAAILMAFVLFRVGRSVHKPRTHAKPTDSADPASAVS